MAVCASDTGLRVGVESHDRTRLHSSGAPAANKAQTRRLSTAYSFRNGEPATVAAEPRRDMSATLPIHGIDSQPCSMKTTAGTAHRVSTRVARKRVGVAKAATK